MALQSLTSHLGRWIHLFILPYLPTWWHVPHREALPSTAQLHSESAIQSFLSQAESQLLEPLQGDGLLRLSQSLRVQMRQRLQDDPACMLPSYSCALPTGREKGRYLALDVGGSTLRVALGSLGGDRDGEMVSFKAYKIDAAVKELVGRCFFDWMASRVLETLHDTDNIRDPDGDLLLSLAWSFPIDQTSLRTGRIRPMGKGFRASDGLVGRDLAQVIESACLRAGLPAKLRVILNDGGATLLSSAYAHETTRFGLILGTGVNVAAYLPVSLVGPSKLAGRPGAWLAAAADVVVNTEAGMFGHGILPATRWDGELRRDLGLDLQPLEYMTSGMYLGEVARRVLVEGIVSHGLLGGVVPASLAGEYSLSTATMAVVESDLSPNMDMAKEAFLATHPSRAEPTAEDMESLRRLFAALSRRSAALVATYVHASWELRQQGLEEEHESGLRGDDRKAAVARELAMGTTTVAFSGSVVESYPGYREMCQGYLDALLVQSPRRGRLHAIDLVPAKESALLGAGVALASLPASSR